MVDEQKAQETVPEIEQVAVPALPYWLSAAHTEYNTSGWITSALSAAGVPAPRWCSTMAGTSAWSWVSVSFGKGRYDAWGWNLGGGGSMSSTWFNNIGTCSGICAAPSFIWELMIVVPYVGNTLIVDIDGFGLGMTATWSTSGNNLWGVNGYLLESITYAHLNWNAFRNSPTYNVRLRTR